MSNTELLSKPKQLWTSALRAVKGDSANELVEAFTSEMTLVAEGLCEDQSRLRQAQDDLAARIDHVHNHTDSELQALEQELQENRRDTEATLNELSRRVAALEGEVRQSTKKEGRKSRFMAGGLMNQITVIVGIAAGSWVLVTILNLFSK